MKTLTESECNWSEMIILKPWHSAPPRFALAERPWPASHSARCKAPTPRMMEHPASLRWRKLERQGHYMSLLYNKNLSKHIKNMLMFLLKRIGDNPRREALYCNLHYITIIIYIYIAHLCTVLYTFHPLGNLGEGVGDPLFVRKTAKHLQNALSREISLQNGKCRF